MSGSFSWSGSSGGDWSDSTQWTVNSPGTADVPGAADSADISATGTYTVTSTGVQFGTVTLGNPSVALVLQPDSTGLLGVVNGELDINAGTVQLGPDVTNGGGAGPYLLDGGGTIANFATIILDQAALAPAATGQTIEVVPTLVNAATLDVVDGTVLHLDDSSGLYNGQFAHAVFQGDGSGGGLIAQAITNFSTISLANAATATISGNLFNAGVVILASDPSLQSGSTLDVMAIDPVSGTSGTIVFADGGPDALIIETASTINYASDFTSVLRGFQAGDAIDFAHHEFTNSSTFSVNGTILQVGNGAQIFAKIKIPNLTPAMAAELMVQDDGNGDYNGGNTGGTELVFNATACFTSGVLIETREGPIPVETIRPGDAVAVLLTGGFRPVTWVGHRRIDCRRHPRPETVWPVRIARGAIGPCSPNRDMLLSPDHAVFLNGVLIPIRLLADGKGIVQVPVDTITYYHVELDQHDVLLADGLPAESFLDTGNRSAFDNGGPTTHLFPDFASLRWEASGCAPMIVTGPELEAARRVIAQRSAELVLAA